MVQEKGQARISRESGVGEKSQGAEVLGRVGELIVSSFPAAKPED